MAAIVRGANGQPMAGAEVWLIDSTAIAAENAVIASRTLGDWVEASRAVAHEVGVSDASGRVGFGHAVNGGLLLAARKDGAFGLAERIKPPAQGEQIEIQLEGRKAYRVVVTDSHGAPAEGVSMTLAAPDPGSPDRPYLLPATATTDAAGTATLYEPPAAATGIIDGLAEIPERLAILRIASLDVTPLSLPADGLSVSVALPSLAPLRVRCRHAAFNADHWSALVQVFPAADGSRSTRTLARRMVDGVLDIPFVTADGDLRLVAVISESSHPERLIGTLTMEATSPEGLELGAEAGGTPAARQVDLPLDAGVLLTGRCVDGAGAAVAGVALDLFVVGDASTSWTLMTDDEGRFRWLLLRPGKPLAKVVVGARRQLRKGDLRATTRLGDVQPGQVVDLGVLTLR